MFCFFFVINALAGRTTLKLSLFFIGDVLKHGVQVYFNTGVRKISVSFLDAYSSCFKASMDWFDLCLIESMIFIVIFFGIAQ
jgi:hypothetical protein